MPELHHSVKKTYGGSVDSWHFNAERLSLRDDSDDGNDRLENCFIKIVLGEDMRTGNRENTRPVKLAVPETTVLDEGKFIRILIQLPGIAEEKIRIDLEKFSVTIIATDTEKQYRKVITLASEVRLSKKRFSNGVLELILEKNNI